MTTLASGSRIGPYEVLSKLGEGGMGEVYRATDTQLKRQVAIKVLPASLAADPDRLARFQREAEVLASLNHPHIAAIHGLEKTPACTALVMELVDGDDLSERIARGPLPLDEALAIAKQIAEALEAAHEQGIIHRDLKPANIKVRNDGTVKVLDFGLAKAVEGAGTAGRAGRTDAVLENSPTLTSPALMTGAGVILGTAAYMAPEQAKGRAVDKRADIWAFGVVLFEMLTGVRAFKGDDVSEVLASVLAREPDWTLLPLDQFPGAGMVVRRCLHRDPKQRFADMQDVRLAMGGAFEVAAPGNATPAATRSRAREYAAWAVAAVMAVAVVVLLVTTLRHPRETQPTSPVLARFSVAAPAGSRRLAGSARAAFSVAPDGQTLAFTARGADNVPHLFVRRLDATGTQQVAGTDGAVAPFWSPDSRSIGFAMEGGLYRVALDGSAPRRLCDVPGSGFRGGTWSPRGVIVFAAQTGGLQQVPDTGGSPTPVTTLEATEEKTAHLWPWFLPDGRHLLFLELGSGTRGTIWATAIDAPARTRVTESNGAAAYAAGWLFSTTESPRTLVAQRFDPEHLTLSGTPQPVRDRLPSANTAGTPAFSVSSSVLLIDLPQPLVSHLEWVDRSGRALATVTPRAVLPEFALAADERRIVANMRPLDAARRGLWLFDGLRPDGTRLTYDGAAIRPLWSPDGRHIYFTGSVSGQAAPFTLALGATAPTAFGPPGPYSTFEDVTRDGRYVVLKKLAEIWTQRVGSAEGRALVQGPFAATRPRVSPDSRWLAYTLDLPSGPEVFAQPFDRPGDRIQISVKGGIGPVWRDDGRELYYEGPAGLMAVSMTERAGAIEAGTPQSLFPVHTQGDMINQPHNFEAAAHGQKFLVNTIVDDSDNVPLEVTLHWGAGLTK